MWEIATLVPTDRPLHALTAALMPLLEPAMTETDRLVEVGKQARHLADAAACARFIGEILDTAADGRVSVVLTLRGDFFGHALAQRPLADRLQDAQVNLGPMNRIELEQAIRMPADKPPPRATTRP